MLISEPEVTTTTTILVFGNRPTIEIQTGIYTINHFGSSDFLPGYITYDYGVCDSAENLLEVMPELEASDQKFVVTLTPIDGTQEPERNGWRWHKWGEYIGNQEPKHEYIYDDVHIGVVYVFHIYKKV